MTKALLTIACGLCLLAPASVRADDKKADGIPPKQNPDPEVDGKKLSEWATLLHSRDILDRQAAVLALARIGPGAVPLGTEVVPLLAVALKDKEVTNVRLWAAHGLGKMGAKAKGAIPQLEAVLKDECGLVRIETARALWRIDQHRAAVPALAAELKDKEPCNRHRAAVMLGEIGPGAKAAVPDLVRALKDEGLANISPAPGVTERPAVREAAARALKKVDPATARQHGIE
jgi:HEAT repeat protein